MEHESQFNPEQEKLVKTRVILEFMRHGNKEKDPNKDDNDIRLSEKGREQTTAKGRKIQPQLEVSVGRGSPRKRAQETALRVMLGNETGLRSDASFEEMNILVGSELKVGKKVTEDQRLNFVSKGELGDEMEKAYIEKRYLKYIIEESDNRARQLGDTITSTYTRQAGNVAELVARYMKVGENFNKIISQSDAYEKFGNQLERYLGTHQGVVESFVAKVLERTQGVELRNKLVQSLGAGFQETQGIHMEIANKGEEQNIFFRYEIPDEKGEMIEQDIEISPQLIQDIIEERRKFDKEISSKNSIQ